MNLSVIDGFVDDALKYIATMIINIINKQVSELMTGLLTAIKKVLTGLIAENGWFVKETSEILTVTKPVAISIVALIFVIEFGKRVVYLETMTTEGVAKPVLMLIIGKILVDNCDTILRNILQISNLITKSILDVEKSTLLDGVFATLKAPKPAGTMESLFNAVTYGCVTIVMLVCMVIILLILCVRGVELALLICVSPMIFATVVGNVTNDIFKNFMKYFTAISMQTIIIAICIKFVGAMSNEEFLNKNLDGIIGQPLKPILTTLMAILLTIFIVQSKKMMLSLLNARG